METNSDDRIIQERAEVEARAAAFQAWWSSHWGDAYRSQNPKNSDKTAVKDAFNAGWIAYREAVDALDEADLA
jgi:hypothetical protein